MSHSWGGKASLVITNKAKVSSYFKIFGGVIGILVFSSNVSHSREMTAISPNDGNLFTING